MKKQIFFITFLLFLGYWITIVFNTRINDVTLSDQLGLFSRFPIAFGLSLVALVILALISMYLKEYVISILFVSLFALYFHGIPWIVEPLRMPDTLVHFSDVVVINNLRHLPLIQNYYYCI